MKTHYSMQRPYHYLVDDTLADVTSKRLRDALGDVRDEPLVNTLANGLAEVEVKALADTLDEGEGKALVDMLADTLSEMNGGTFIDTLSDVLAQVLVTLRLKEYYRWKW